MLEKTTFIGGRLGSVEWLRQPPSGSVCCRTCSLAVHSHIGVALDRYTAFLSARHWGLGPITSRAAEAELSLNLRRFVAVARPFPWKLDSGAMHCECAMEQWSGGNRPQAAGQVR